MQTTALYILSLASTMIIFGWFLIILAFLQHFVFGQELLNADIDAAFENDTVTRKGTYT